MIVLLRIGSLLVNVAVLVGVPLWLGASWPPALACAALSFLVCWRLTATLPRTETAAPEVCEAATRAARGMDAPAPRFVRACAGWTAASVRARHGYGLIVGQEVAPQHREAVLAHEIAHFLCGDLFWEPFTDGPGRLLWAAARRVPPLVVIAFPFWIFGAPLARLTELRADRLAARAVSA